MKVKPAQSGMLILACLSALQGLASCGAGLTNDPGTGESPFVLILTEALPAVVTAGECAEYQYTVRVVEREDQKTIYVDSDVEVSLTTSDGATALQEKGFLQTSSNCNGNDSSITIAKGLAEATFFLQLTSTEISQISLSTDDERVGGLSASIAVTPNLPGALELSGLPATAGINVIFTSNPSVRILDAWGNFTDDSSSALEIEPFTDATCTQAAGGTIQNASITAIDGIGAFTNLRYTTSGTIYLRAQIPATQIRSNCAGPIAVQ